ncbi:MAG TPA: flagellar motor switch protein FliN [Alphaproteobacteria bacterium]|jgi:flagellar motor switch protein FliN/FliY|nr:flagellar motor switch protein FliN [Alphaproteobacteria bacterium]
MADEDEMDTALAVGEGALPSTAAGDLVGSGFADAVFQVPVSVSIRLGVSTMQIRQLLKLTRGAVLELDRGVGEPIDIYVNDRRIARGEVIVVDGRLGVTLTEVLDSSDADGQE